MGDDRGRAQAPEPGDGSAPRDEPSRRAMLGVCAVGGCAIGGVVLVPAAGLIADPLRNKGDSAKRFVLARLDDLVVGVAKKVSIVGDEVDAWTRAEQRRLGAVWLTRIDDVTVRALSVTCPHLGCGIELRADGGAFSCPCHDSAFDLQGARTGGPSPRAMDPLVVEITPSREVAVTFTRFRIGVAAREEIGG